MSCAAVYTAAYFPPSQIAELTRQHRAEQDRAKQFLRLHVRKILGAQADELSIRFDLVDAHPVDAVLDAAKRHRAGLIVMGILRRGFTWCVLLRDITLVARNLMIPIRTNLSLCPEWATQAGCNFSGSPGSVIIRDIGV